MFSFNHSSNDTTAIDPADMKAVGTLPLGGVPELAVSDEKGHVFVNMEDTSEIVEFDARTLKVLNRFPLAPGEEPTGLAFDPKGRKLFSTCANRKLVIMDANSGKVIQTLEIDQAPTGASSTPRRAWFSAPAAATGRWPSSANYRRAGTRSPGPSRPR